MAHLKPFSLLSAAVAALCCWPAAAEGGPTVLTSFDAETADLGWRTVNDNVMGGRSTGGFRVESGVLVFAGSTNTDGGGFSSIRSSPNDLSLGEAAGIHLRVRGDGRTYTFRLRTSGTRAAYWAEFPTKSDGEWEEVRIPFSAFTPRWRGRLLEGPKLDPARIQGLGLMIYDKRDGPFRLEVDWIKGFGSFSMDRFRWKNRPLLLFAPDAEDKHLQEQLSQIAESRAALAERHMVILVVLEMGPSRAGEFEISRDDARRLRERYAIEQGAFGLRLVGKDGGVKRDAERPVALQSLFDQIDAMPMRQAEMSR